MSIKLEKEKFIRQAHAFIRPTALQGILSPFIATANIFFLNGEYAKARMLLECIGLEDPHYIEAATFKDRIYEQEIDELKNKLKRSEARAEKDMRERQLQDILPVMDLVNVHSAEPSTMPPPIDFKESLKVSASFADIALDRTFGEAIIFSNSGKYQPTASQGISNPEPIANAKRPRLDS